MSTADDPQRTDLETICRAVAEGKRVDPAIVKRVKEKSDAMRRKADDNLSVERSFVRFVKNEAGLDASVALRWVREEKDSGRALFLRVEMEPGLHEYLAPDIFPIEISHVLTKFSRQNIMSADEAETHLASIMATLPQLVRSVDLLPAAFAIAQKTRTSFYDALYIALGESEGVPVITVDHKMAKLPYNIIELSKLGA